MSYLIQYLPIIFALAIYVARMLEVGTKRKVIPGPVQEKTTFRMFMFSGILLIIGGITEYVLKGFSANWILLALGVILAISSFVIRRKTIAALGEFWSLHIEIRDNHQFVQSGTFRWMRHPTYFSMILELLSVILILSAYWSGLAAFLIFIPALHKRISAEEVALVGKFGEDYRTYQRQTPLLFPVKVP